MRIMDPVILLPLYIYPHLGAWDRLYNASVPHFFLNFPLTLRQYLGASESALHNHRQPEQRSRVFAMVGTK
jgi:hypothetical protein